MMGRILALVAVIAAVSVGMAGIASRTTASDDGGRSETRLGNDGGWGARNGGGRSSASNRTSAAGEVRLGRAGDSHFYTDANIDGTRVRMMIDSGASIVALTRRDAETIGIDVDRLPIGGVARTAGGEVPMRTVTLDSIDIDGIEVRGVQAAVIDADMGVSLLGQSYLSKLDAVNVEGDTMTLR